MFCPNCGATVQGRFCAKCGTAVDAGAAAPGGTTPGGTTPGGTTPGAQPYTAPSSGAGGLTTNMAAALSYVLGFITGIIFLVLAPYNQNKFVRFHAFQSIFLMVAWIVFQIAQIVLVVALPWYLMSVISLVVSLGFLAVWIICLVKAYSGELFKLPIIGDLAQKQA